MAKKRFFDTPNENTLAMTTTYEQNEWLSETDLQLFEEMRLKNPRRYKTAGLGDWGIAEGLIYKNWKEEAFDIDDLRKEPHIQSIFGLDFGYTNDPSALFCGLIDTKAKTIWVFDKMYQKGMSNESIYNEIQK